MRDLWVAGAPLRTTNAIARQVLLYARELAGARETDVIDIPIVVDEAPTGCTLLVGSCLPLASTEVSGTEPGHLPGEDDALFEMLRRTDGLLARLDAARLADAPERTSPEEPPHAAP